MTQLTSVRLPFKNQLMDTVVAKTQNHTVFFDTGVYSSAKKLEALCQGQVTVLNTHGDWDHIGANRYLQDRGAKIYVHQADAAKQTNLPDQWVYGHTQFAGLYSVTQEDTRYFEDEAGQALTPDAELYDGQILTFDQLKAKVLHTPGHSAGCCCFYLEDEGALITGDTLQGNGFYGLMPVLSDAYAWMDSLKKLMKVEAERTYIAHAYELDAPENVLCGAQALKNQLALCLEVAQTMEKALLQLLESQADDPELTLKQTAQALADSVKRPRGFGACLTALSFLRHLQDRYPVAKRIVSQYVLRA